MTNFIPIFPLAIVIYPGEHVNLHIFEPRYKQLVKDCFESKKPFGIPVVINHQVAEMGTLVRITEINKVYDDGKMDIKTEGQDVFKILEILKELPDKLYSGAIVTYPANITKSNVALRKKVVAGIRQIHKLLNITKEFEKPDDQLVSYDVAHHAGLSMEEEYHLLELPQELQRLEYLKRHIAKVIPIMAEMDVLKGKVKMNGHFKNLEGFQFGGTA